MNCDFMLTFEHQHPTVKSMLELRVRAYDIHYFSIKEKKVFMCIRLLSAIVKAIGVAVYMITLIAAVKASLFTGIICMEFS